MEELWSRGEAGVDFDSTPRIIEPDHFQCLFLIMGCLFSIWLIVALFDILTNSDFGFLKLMLAGLFACLMITFYNLFLFSTALYSPITRHTEERIDRSGWIASPAKSIFTGEYEIDLKILIKNKMVAIAILGYGAVSSFIFIFIAVIRSLGKTHFRLKINILLLV